MTDSPKTITDLDLDRLIDGELSPAERSELLGALDASPDGWRRCAIAFLETQALRRELGALATETPEPARPPSAPRVPPARRWPSAGWLALAASLLVAFAVGLAAPRIWRADTSSPQPHLASGGGGDSRAPLGRPEPAPPEASVAAAPDPDVVTFWTRDARGERHSLRAPLIDAQELSKRYGVRLPSATPPGLYEEFEDRGLQLKTRQRFAPLNTDDGRTLVVPVEDVQVTPLRYL